MLELGHCRVVLVVVRAILQWLRIHHLYFSIFMIFVYDNRKLLWRVH